MLKHRILSGSLLILALVFVVRFSTGWTNIFLPLLVSLIASIALLEFYYLMEQKGYTPLRTWGVGFSVAYIFIIFFVALKKPLQIEDLALMPIYLAIMTATMVITARQDISKALSTLSSTLAGFFYITWLISFVLRIILWRGAEQMDGRYFCLYFIAVVKGTDVAAYFFGSWFGRHKLAPKISPRKTIEGSIAGWIFAALLGALIAMYLPSVRESFQILAIRIWPGVDAWFGVLIGGITALLLSSLGQFGDLAESIFKRDANVKDSGGYIPGMGGALDVIDSLLFAAPMMYLLMKVLEKL